MLEVGPGESRDSDFWPESGLPSSDDPAAKVQQLQDGAHGFRTPLFFFLEGSTRVDYVSALPLDPYCQSFAFRFSFFPKSALDCDPSTYASCIAGPSDTHHYVWLMCQDGVSLTFCIGYP
jgi:hypothetical protein